MKMTMKSSAVKHTWVLATATMLALASCTKPEMDDDFPKGDPPPVAGFVNSADIQPGELVVHLPFENNATDAKGTLTNPVPSGNVTYVAGRKGRAYKGADNAFIGFNSGAALANATSFTVSFWINTQKHAANAQSVFMLGKADGSFWGNFFVLIEANSSTSNAMQLKLHFEKNVTPPVQNVEQWLDPANRAGDMYGNWRQVTYTYDAATSKVAFYANGNPITLSAGEADRKADPTTPLGPIAFKSADRFVIGGFQNHLGSPFGGIETFMKTYTGALDEFRIYKKALTGAEVLALFQLERQGR